MDITYKGRRKTAVLKESVGGDLDYKHIAYDLLGIVKQNLLLIDDIVYNANEAGNYLWGMVLAYHLFPITPTWIAEQGTKGRHDEAWEQRAIVNGQTKGFNFPKESIPAVRKYVMNYRPE